MSWESKVKSHPWLKYYKPVEKDFRIQCQVPKCEKEYRYAHSATVTKHVVKTHENIYECEAKMIDPLLGSTSWSYFRLSREGSPICLLCNETVTQGNMSLKDMSSEHLKTHLENQVSNEDVTSKIYYYRNLFWIWKYMTYETAFTAKCNLCVENVQDNIQIYLSSTRVLRNHLINEHHIDISSIDESNELSWEYQISKYKSLEKYYTKAQNFQAKCKYCNKEIKYIDAEVMRTHMKNRHEDFYTFEEQIHGEKWEYFRFHGSTEQQDQNKQVECILCHKILSNKAATNDHICSTKLLEFHKSEYWPLKYVLQEKDEKDIVLARCSCCKEQIRFHFFRDNLERHILLHISKPKGIEQLLKAASFIAQQEENIRLDHSYSSSEDTPSTSGTQN